MLEAPTIFWGIWKLVSPFIDQTTRKRIHFVYGAAAREQLVKVSCWPAPPMSITLTPPS